MRILSILFFLFIGILYSSGQICVVGKIESKNDNGQIEAVQFAGVLLRDKQDSTIIDYATLTDAEGKYIFDNVIMKEYILEVSSLGYDSIRKNIIVVYPEVGNSISFDYELIPNTKQLNEVVVKANSINKGLTKSSYSITQSDIESARFAMDLLGKIPNISIDPVSQKIKNSSGSLRILINGIPSSEIDLKAIPANKILRIDYYDIPPARYAEYNAVIDVITKNLDNGYSAGITMQHAFTTGFFNDDFFVKYNNGKHQISFDYTINYRNYNKVNTVTSYNFLINETTIDRTENSTNPFGYKDNSINLNYTYQNKDNTVFQAKFSPNLLTQTSKDNSEIQIINNDSIFQRTGTGLKKSHTFNPSLNIYLWKQLGEKQIIVFDLLGNIFNSSQLIKKQEYDLTNSKLELNDYMSLQNLKKSFIGEMIFERFYGNNKLSIGNKLETYLINSKIDNSFDNSNYKSSFLSNYLYGEYTGFFNNFMYRSSLGLTYRKSQNDTIRNSSVILRPFLLLGYKINTYNTLRIILTQLPNEPDISEQSDNVIFITDNILKTGNPLLKNSLSKIIGIYYSFVNSFFDASTLLYYAQVKDNISSYYINDGNYFLQKSINDRKYKNYGLNYSFGIKPFGKNTLNIKLSGSVSKYEVENEFIGNYFHLYMPLNYQVSYNWDKWTFFHQVSLVDYDLDGTYLQSNENNMNFILQYKKNNFSVTGSLLFAFNPSRYITKTISKSIVQYLSDRKIYDNKNMFTLGFTYIFNSGKEYENTEKKINNNDTDSGIFK